MQVLLPTALPSLDMLQSVHEEAYLQDFLAGQLPAAMQRRIGLSEVLASRVMINRTLWEVAGLRPSLGATNVLTVNASRH